MADARLLTLTFHHVGPTSRSLEPGEAAVSVTQNALLEILDAVSERDDVELTFDDGNRSDLEIALPALLDRSLVASFFTCAERLEHRDFLAREDLRQLAVSGMGIGTHGMRHRPWRGLTPFELAEELMHARDLLEDASGMRISEASCPFGAYDRRVLRALASAGYRRVYTSDGGVGRSGAWLQPRYSVRRGDRAETILSLLERESDLPLRVALTRALLRALKRWR